jgi:hypothetical protein
MEAASWEARSRSAGEMLSEVSRLGQGEEHGDEGEGFEGESEVALGAPPFEDGPGDGEPCD